MSGFRMMPNSRITLSVIAFFSAIMLIWLLVSLSVLKPVDLEAISPLEFTYFISVLVVYVYFWFYFFHRPRGSKVVVDGRTALSVCAFIVGFTLGYALIDYRILVPQDTSELSTGGFGIFVASTIVPVLAWLFLYIYTLRRKNAALSGRV